MEKVILFLWFVPSVALCQVVVNFENGNLEQWQQSISGRWSADTTSSVSGNYSLHHSFDNPESGTDQAGLPVSNLQPSLGSAQWSFKVRHGYDPSASNNWSVFLMADNGPVEMHPGGNVNGYALGVNLAGYDDTLRLWKVKGGIVTIVTSLPVNWQNNVGTSAVATIEAQRTQTGIWTIRILNPGGSIIGSASGSDEELFIAAWFGIYYKYSSTRDRLLWIDDIIIDGVFVEDTVPPQITQTTAINKNSVRIKIDEETNMDFSPVDNFSLNIDSAHVSKITRIDQYSYIIEFTSPFINKKINTLSVGKICDMHSNCAENISLEFTPAWAEPGDIIISEIMADPAPQVSLPSAEYFEIKNNSKFRLSLDSWKLVGGEQISVLPCCELSPGEYAVVCSVSDTSLFTDFGRVVGIRSFPALTDEGKLLLINDSYGDLIHGVDYSDEWYGDQLKSDGGWSLEMIDTDYPFYSAGNWKASLSKSGGTPCRPNSVSKKNIDNSFKGITNVFPQDSLTVKVEFSEPLFNYENLKEKILIGGKPVSSFTSDEYFRRKFTVVPCKPLERGNLYFLELPQDISDFAGNKVENRSFRFGLPEDPVNGDIVFNELLFNPLPGDPDFIEFFNNSGKTADASRLFLVSVNDETGDTSELVQVSDLNRCFLPVTMMVITTNRDQLISRYPSCAEERIFNVGQLPSMPDDKGHIVLFNRELDVLDEVRYSERMHYSLISEPEGISLEKVVPAGSSLDAGNWHSASESSGWATPGEMNSVYSEMHPTEDLISFSSTRISPDNDGYEDVLVIDLNLTGTRNVASINIFDETGGLVKRLAENLFAGSQATVVWNATADDGSLVRTGIYVVLITVFDDTGKTAKWKRVCTVIR